MTTQRPLLEIRDVSIDYVTQRGRLRAVDGVSLDIDAGEIVGLVGESGSGKSTLGQALLRVLGPPAVISGGQAIFDGADLFRLDEAALARVRWREIALVFQSAMNALNPVATVQAQIMDVLRARERLDRETALDRARLLLGRMGLSTEVLRAYPHELSGGMKQRIVIAIALALEPRLLIMDEPTTALDVVVQRDILQHIRVLQKARGFAVLLISHDLSLMLELADRVAILYAGRIAEVLPTELLAGDGARHPYTVGLLSSFPTLLGRPRRIDGIPGAPPDLFEPPSGCRFHPRCSAFEAVCKGSCPVVRPLGPRHVVSCHLAK